MQSSEKNELVRKVENALNNIRPFLQSDGGDIELIDVTDDLIVKVKLLGNCDGCRMSTSTMKYSQNICARNNCGGSRVI